MLFLKPGKPSLGLRALIHARIVLGGLFGSGGQSGVLGRGLTFGHKLSSA